MDSELLKRFQQGDTTAFAQLAERYQRPLFAYLGRMGLEQAVAEELAQDSFIRVWQARERFDAGQSAFSTWLFTIARRLAINEMERRSRQQTVSIEHEKTAGDWDVQADHSMQQMMQNEQQLRLRNALNRLSVHDRSLLALAYLRELEYSAIARIEDIPPGTVKSRLHRIRERLKTLLDIEND